MSAALAGTGASVLTGISATKLVGVAVLAAAPSALFRLYYFRVYVAVLLAGTWASLVAIPAAVALASGRRTRAR
jgi:Niemann-Pick C1 protein